MILSFVVEEFARFLYLFGWAESVKNTVSFSTFISNFKDSTPFNDPEGSFRI